MTCPTFKWKIWEEDGDGPEWGDEIYAETASTAVRRWAETKDSQSDYWILESGYDGIIVNIQKGSDAVIKMKVRAEQSIDYYVTEV